MSDLMFNIENIFSTDQRNGLLGKNNTVKFYIPPYQRGYKWPSDGQNAWVRILLQDFLDAFENNEEQYLLQYITVKKRLINSVNVLEIIDGQQRITTLIILFAVISYKSNFNNHYDNIASDKLIYGIRENVQNFLEEFLFNNLPRIIDYSWSDFINNYEKYNEQDIYYLFSAVKKIHKMLTIDNNRLANFEKYIKGNVYLIVNLVKENVSGEKLFSNLNSNRVELTDTELIKGLLLTKVSRQLCSAEDSFKELLELRTFMGRKWDDITRWVNDAEIKSFYFPSSHSAMYQFLELIAVRNRYIPTSNGDKYSLFNFFQSKLKRDRALSLSFYTDIKLFYSLLRDWYNSNEIYNRIGFLFFPGRKDRIQLILSLLEKDKSLLKKELMTMSIALLPNDITSLEYGVDYDEIHKVLLALSIFLNEDYRFNFHLYQNERWSIEHIFPQNPSDLPNNLGNSDIRLLKNLIKYDIKSIEFTYYKYENETEEEASEIYATLLTKLDGDTCVINDREKDLLNKLIRTEKLNSIGNLSLLTGTDNSSNSNGMFDYKRRNIINRISKGSFVPKHTYDVFSKLLSDDFDPDLTVWSEKDIDAHAEWIEKSITHIKNR